MGTVTIWFGKIVILTMIMFSILRTIRPESNMAINKPANQSSGTHHTWVASKVVDGCVKTDIGANCCTHTNATGPKTVWWQVDLSQPTTINSISIYYRAGYGARFAGYHLYVSNTTDIPPDRILCYEDKSSTNASVQLIITHQCPYVGRYVTVYNYRNDTKRYPWYDNYAVLELCEVQVWGCPVGTYGDGNCNSACSGNCNGGNCNATTGDCFCCVSGTYGHECENTCSMNCNGMACAQDTGRCTVCIPTWYGDMCNLKCPQSCSETSCDRTSGNCFGCLSGTYGNKCEKSCSMNCKELLCERNFGRCTDCITGRYGDTCDRICSNNCNGNVCERDNGHCSDCVSGTYGLMCENSCSSNCNAMLCDRTSGRCADCITGRYGDTCDQICSNNCKGNVCERNNGHCSDCVSGTYGLMCENSCSSNCNAMLCDRTSARCADCITGRYGDTCDQICSNNCTGNVCERNNGHCSDCVSGTYGLMCENSCSSNCNAKLCDRTSGRCADCVSEQYGETCDISCPESCNGTTCGRNDGHCLDCVAQRYGDKCERNCSQHCKDRHCHKDDGQCVECNPGKYGATCDMDCPEKCNRRLCEQTTGHCKGCVKGSYGIDCSTACDTNCLECDQQNGECTECAAGLYGTNCTLTCGHCSSCLIYSGVCVTPCDDGYQGDLCATRQAVASEDNAPSVDAGPIVGAVVGVIVVGVVAIVIVLFIRRRRLNADRQKPFSDIGESNKNLYLEPVESKNRKSGMTDGNIYSNISEQDEPSEAGASVYMNTGLVEEASGSGDVYYNSGQIGFPVSELKSIVETKMKNKAKAFEDEYNSIPSGALHKHTIGTLDYNKVKNRFKTTFPYDHSRVILDIVGKNPHTDYINANYIDGVTKPALYVATQGPRPGTVNDFWRMIWQLQTGKIVMLTNLIEGGKPKCDKYWPDEGEKPLDTPHFYIALERERAYAFYVIRDFKVTEKKTKTVRQVHQFHYTTWPDHGTPDPNELVVFHRRVKNYEAVMKGRMVVHCSAGIGRTGTFIALDALLEYGKETERIDVLQYIKTMRKDRVNMVQTVEQYIAVHQLLLEAFDMPDTLIPRMKFHSELSALSNGGPINQTKLRQEYQMTQSTKPNYGKNDYRAALLPSNQMKNRTLSVLAADRFRTYLQSHSSKRTDYINAVMLPSYTSKTGYIVTQTPLEDTVVDLLTMIMDHNCHTLVVIDTDVIEWLPSDGGFKTISNYRLDHKGKSSTVECLDLHALEIGNSENNTSINLRVFHMTGWDRDSPVPKDSSVLLQLLELVDSRRKSDDTKTTIVMCRDGHSQSGLFCCISNARDQMKCDEEVDIYQISRQLLVRRPEFLINFDQYQCCYTMLRDYLDTDDVYIN
ncbi:receptor-type tyrosine-protein phosphatase kappa-like isoform X4 [Argopecten irradians]|uniref:receptor-type tyrosine-protein phosphatase kappa-like isoform X4 n=1 Tax=Argopecten irradians TaxID=31199 RepID=UPI0037170212